MAPRYNKIGDIKIPFVTMPHWVGDPQSWRFPPVELGMPVYEISFRKHKGFRIDDEPCQIQALICLIIVTKLKKLNRKTISIPNP
jgi:hypothetical protein